MSARSTLAVARSARVDRLLVSALGLVLLAGGLAVLVVGAGAFGVSRAGRTVVDPLAVGWVVANRPLTLGTAIAAGLLLVVLGLQWAVRSARPELAPDVVLDRSLGHGLTITSGALTDAMRADAETVTGVSRARVRLVGSADAPALRLTLWLHQGADLRTVWEELDSQVLVRARDALDVTSLPTAVRIELDAANRRRVE